MKVTVIDKAAELYPGDIKLQKAFIEGFKWKESNVSKILFENFKMCLYS